jgi:hypothetical protein
VLTVNLLQAHTGWMLAAQLPLCCVQQQVLCANINWCCLQTS